MKGNRQLELPSVTQVGGEKPAEYIACNRLATESVVCLLHPPCQNAAKEVDLIECCYSKRFVDMCENNEIYK